MSRGPLPSQLCLLSSLPYRADGDKVRFLGCVFSYSTSAACLRLAHDYPQGTDVTAVVDVNLLLNTLGHEKTRVGEWVNVIGYVTRKQRMGKPTTPGGFAVHVQALVVWSTGPLDVQRYEKTFDRGSI